MDPCASQLKWDKKVKALIENMRQIDIPQGWRERVWVYAWQTKCLALEL